MGFRRDFPGKRVTRKGYVVKRVLDKIFMNLRATGGDLAEKGRSVPRPYEGKEQPRSGGPLKIYSQKRVSALRPNRN